MTGPLMKRIKLKTARADARAEAKGAVETAKAEVTEGVSAKEVAPAGKAKLGFVDSLRALTGL